MPRGKYWNIAASLLVLAAQLLSAQGKQAVTAGDRQAVDLTIYNANLALVREERIISLTKGMGRIVIPEIPATIDGTSLHFRSVTDPAGVRVLEQNYQYDLVHQAKLLERYLGKEIEFVRLNEETKKEYTVVGRLLSTGYAMRSTYGSSIPVYDYAGGLVAEVNGKIELNPAGRLVLPSLPDGLILRPQLEWLVSAGKGGEHRTEISYLAGGLSWTSDYVALLSKDDAKLDLTGWVTLTNQSGSSFRNASLKLVAGDVNLVKKDMEKRMRAEMAMDAVQEAQPQFKQTELFEYKLYTLQRRTDVLTSETKQVELVSGRDVASKKVFVYDGIGDEWRYWYGNTSYRSQGSFGQQSNPKVGVFVMFRNDEQAGLGIPLPKGKVRVYKRDDDGKEQFVGEDRIDHTPKDEEVRLYLGNAFDIVGERAQKDFRSYAGGRVVEETIEIKVRNHKKESVTVMVYEHPWRWTQWDVVRSSGDWTKVDQSTLRFPVTIPKDGEGTVTYTVKYSW
jgi:hypothetical protein